jgi:hypothetical protein
MLTELICHERTPAYRDDSTMLFGPRRADSSTPRIVSSKKGGRSTKQQWNNAKRSISFIARFAL